MATPVAGADAPAGEALRYVCDREPGIRRRRCGQGFAYYLPSGGRVDDAGMLARIRSLAIPPAYREVWICCDPAGHLQATGRDARGRKQYRYHPEWRVVRDADKFARMAGFGAALPRVRRRVTRDLRQPGLPRTRVLAAVVRLLETTLMRVGNQEYLRTNRSYGLTTLRNRHVDIARDALRIEFRGKHGVVQRARVSDAQLAAVVRRCRDLPGQVLFQYLDADGERHAVGSSDVNDYLRQATGSDFTAKDFRTWFGSLSALERLSGREPGSPAQAQRCVAEVVREVAQQLGNTPAICRKCYVHPAVIEAFLDGELVRRDIRVRGERRLLEVLDSRAAALPEGTPQAGLLPSREEPPWTSG